RNSLFLKKERWKKIFSIFKRYCCVLQKDENDCGAACILTIAKQYNSIVKLRQISGTDKNGTNLAGMIKGLDYLGFDSKAVKVEDKKIDNSVSFPIIAHIQTTNNFLHYVVVHDLYLF
ncbi:peptidase, C39 family, partial [Leptotrichia wadei]